MSTSAMRAPSGVVTLPRFLSAPRRKYITETGGQWSPETVALCFALALREHGTVAAVRSTARQLVDKVPRESQPNMKRIWREATDQQAIDLGVTIINRVCDLTGIAPGLPFELNKPDPEPPKCHMKPMKLSGYHEHRHWRCQHCSHTKPLGWRPS
ncbi:hypothetical protein [Pseudomonas sp.]|uniref:DUF7740 domain-containing protein n=1 Tax=Pseudomonas sp. TaxID=306 RepID=UPI002588C00F|nr:hypothetical protein [Pseudomonas sp.]